MQVKHLFVNIQRCMQISSFDETKSDCHQTYSTELTMMLRVPLSGAPFLFCWHRFLFLFHGFYTVLHWHWRKSPNQSISLISVRKRRILSTGGESVHPSGQTGRPPRADTADQTPVGRHPLDRDPPIRRSLQRTVRILLQCILVKMCFLLIDRLSQV